jgi:hypothetical protein
LSHTTFSPGMISRSQMTHLICTRHPEVQARRSLGGWLAHLLLLIQLDYELEASTSQASLFARLHQVQTGDVSTPVEYDQPVYWPYPEAAI